MNHKRELFGFIILIVRTDRNIKTIMDDTGNVCHRYNVVDFDGSVFNDLLVTDSRYEVRVWMDLNGYRIRNSFCIFKDMPGERSVVLERIG